MAQRVDPGPAQLLPACSVLETRAQPAAGVGLAGSPGCPRDGSKTGAWSQWGLTGRPARPGVAIAGTLSCPPRRGQEISSPVRTRCVSSSSLRPPGFPSSRWELPGCLRSAP